jgi:OOP family OmpA-OmpF porin
VRRPGDGRGHVRDFFNVKKEMEHVVKTPFRYSLLAAALLGLAGTAQANDPGTGIDGYVDDSRHVRITSTYTSCVRTGYWTPSLGVAECEGGPARAEAPFEPKRAETAVEPAPAPIAAPAPVPAAAPVTKEPQASVGATAPRSVISGEVAFDFDRFQLNAQARDKLDSLAEQLKFFTLEEVVATGHADRIGGEAYNQRLSERRAAAVKDYLVEKGVDAQRIQTVGVGESESVTGEACRNMGRENRFNRKLIECLSPDRRVGVEATGVRPQLSSR